MMKALERAIAACNGHTALASAIGCAPNVPSMWKIRGHIPAEHCPSIERATINAARDKGDARLIVRCEELRPDVAWEVLRAQVEPAPDSAKA